MRVWLCPSTCPTVLQSSSIQRQRQSIQSGLAMHVVLVQVSARCALQRTGPEQKMMICNTCTPVSELRFASDWLSLCLRRVAYMSAQRFAMDMMDDTHALTISQSFSPNDCASTRRAVKRPSYPNANTRCSYVDMNMHADIQLYISISLCM